MKHLTAEVARLTGESKTEAIRRALEERRRTLNGDAAPKRHARVLRLLQTNVWPTVPNAQIDIRGLNREEQNAAVARDILFIVGDFRLTDVRVATYPRAVCDMCRALN